MEVLAQYLLSYVCTKQKIPFKPLAPAAVKRLRHHAWPGNVRELQNVLERAVLLSRRELIGRDDIVFDSDHSEFSPPEPVLPNETLSTTATGSARQDDVAAAKYLQHPGELDGHWFSMEEIEKWYIRLTLEYTHYNQTAAAKLLGMHRNVLRHRMQKYGLLNSPSATSNETARADQSLNTVF